MAPKSTAPSKEELVAAYKKILQSYIDLRPSGIRLKIADAIGKHKSFVSQIANPGYPVPVPARHVGAIMDICHFSPEEREAFLAAYRRAHPNQSRKLQPSAHKRAGHHTIHIEVPLFEDPERQHEVEETIRQFARRLIALARSDGD